MKMKVKVQANPIALALILLSHVLVLNFLFVPHSSPRENREKQLQLIETVMTGGKEAFLKRNWLETLKIYFGNPMDEAYYYEWSSAVLGKPIEPEYVIFKELSEVDPQSESKKIWENLFSLSKDPRLKIPYLDVPFEYPPLLMIPILATGALSTHYLDYTRTLALLITCTYLMCLALMNQIGKKMNGVSLLHQPMIVFFLGSVLLATGKIFVTRLDIFPVLFCLLALHDFIREKYYRSGFWVVLGAFSKIYPLLLAPLLLIFLIRQGKKRPAAFVVIFAFALSITLLLALSLLTHGHYWGSLQYHAHRGIQIESLYTLIPYLSHLFFEVPVQIYFNYGSFNLNAPSIPYLLKASSIIPILLPVTLYFILWRTPREKLSNPILIQSFIILVLGFIITLKILSPQFLIWLIPLIFWVFPSPSSPLRRNIFLSLFTLTLLMTQALYPSLYLFLRQLNPSIVALLVTRNLLLTGLFLWLWIDWRKNLLTGPGDLP